MSRSASAPLPPVLRLLGPSGSGKTTLGERLVEQLARRGVRTAVVKSARHHAAPPDKPHSDTARYAEAGAAAVAGAFAFETVLRLPSVPGIDTLRAMLAPVCDLVLVEGHRDASLPSLAFVEGCAACGEYLVFLGADGFAPLERPVRPLHRDEVERIADAVEDWLGASGAASQQTNPRQSPRDARALASDRVPCGSRRTR
jgi:molybdopterin-guanine dinucleotide biosynthesis protein MobB